MGYFVVDIAGLATDFTKQTLQSDFGQNFHVRYPSVFKIQREQLVLVKGGHGSRLLKKACRISSEGTDRFGRPLKVLSPEMRKVFGDFAWEGVDSEKSSPMGRPRLCRESNQVCEKAALRRRGQTTQER